MLGTLKICAAVIVIACFSTCAAEEAGSPERLKKFMEERVDTTQEVYERVFKAFQNGFRTIEELTRAQMSVFRAKLDLCTTKAQRIEVYEEMIKASDQLEKYVKARVEQGTATDFEANVVKLERLEAKIALEKERLAK